jgi:hypothetical protein
MANPLTWIMPVIPGKTPEEIFLKLAWYWPRVNEALKEIGTVHYARMVLLDLSQPGLRPNLIPKPGDRYALALITDFDGDMAAYVSDFVVKIGDFFDAMLEFVVGGAEVIPVAQHVEAFADLIGAGNLSQHGPNNLLPLFEAYPYTVRQIAAANVPPDVPYLWPDSSGGKPAQT